MIMKHSDPLVDCDNVNTVSDVGEYSVRALLEVVIGEYIPICC